MDIDLKDISLLIVDDDAPVASSLRRLFRRAGFAVTIAGCGKAGISLLDSVKPRVVISDYRMPDISGIEVLQEVQRRFPSTIRVLISGYADSGTLQSQMKSLASEKYFFFVPKPWDDERFVARVVAALREQESTDQFGLSDWIEIDAK